MNNSAINVLGQVSAEVAERCRNPRNYGPLETWNGHARITGPCGDAGTPFVHRMAESPAARSLMDVGHRIEQNMASWPQPGESL